MGRVTHLLGVTIFALFALTGCSHKLVVMTLDDAIKSVAERARQAQCDGVIFAKEYSAEFYVETAHKLSAGAPTGAIPIVLSGETSLKESTKITVHMEREKNKASCDQNVIGSFAPTLYLYDPSEGTAKELSH